MRGNFKVGPLSLPTTVMASGDDDHRGRWEGDGTWCMDWIDLSYVIGCF